MKPYIKFVGLSQNGAVNLEKYLCDQISRQVGLSDMTKQLEARLASLFSPLTQQEFNDQDLIF